MTSDAPIREKPPGYSSSQVGIAIVFGCEILAILFRLQFDLSAPRTSDNVYDGWQLFMGLIAIGAGALVGSLILIFGLVRQYRAGSLTPKWVVWSCVALLPIVVGVGALVELFTAG